MATLDKKKFLADQKWKADLLINANKDTNIAGRKEDAKSFLDTWRLNNIGTKDSGVLPPVNDVPPHLRGIIFRRAAVDSMKIAHGSHEATDLGDGIPRYLDGHDPKDHNPPVDPSGNPIEELRPKDEDIPLAWLRSSGSGPMTNNEFTEGLKIINSSSPDPATRDWRELQLIKQAIQGV